MYCILWCGAVQEAAAAAASQDALHRRRSGVATAAMKFNELGEPMSPLFPAGISGTISGTGEMKLLQAHGVCWRAIQKAKRKCVRGGVTSPYRPDTLLRR